MVQLRPRASRARASAMVDEDQPASEEEAEHGVLLGQSSSGAAAEPPEGDEDDADDEAPEELTFASAQLEARAEERRVRETVRRDKTLLKEKRKRREELFIEQKKRKLLPDAILEKLIAAPQTTSLKKSPGKLKEVDLQKKSEECEKGSGSKKAKVQKVQAVGHNKSYVAVRLKDQELRDSRQQAAQAFIQNSLYGPGTNRTTVNKFLSLENKRLPVKKAAAHFLNNTWGTQKKQNAKRFKRRWMVRRMKTSKK